MRRIVAEKFPLLKDYNDKEYNNRKMELYKSVDISEYQHTSCKITNSYSTYLGKINGNMMKVHLTNKKITIIGLPIDDNNDIDKSVKLVLQLMKKYECRLYISEIEKDIIESRFQFQFPKITSLQGENDNDFYDEIPSKINEFKSSRYRNKRLGGFLDNELNIKPSNISFRLLEGEKCEKDLYEKWSEDKGNLLVRKNVYRGIFKHRDLFKAYGLFIDNELVQSVYLIENAKNIWYMYARFGVKESFSDKPFSKEMRYSGNITRCLLYKELLSLGAERIYVDGGYDNPETGEELKKHKVNSYDLVEKRYLVAL